MLGSMVTSDRWITVVTAWDGPDQRHPLVVRLTLEYNDRTETKVCLTPADAAVQLERWLEERLR